MRFDFDIWIFPINRAVTAASAAKYKSLLQFGCVLQCALMENEHVFTDDHIDRQLTHDAELIPKDKSTDQSLKYRESMQIQHASIAAYDLYPTDWSY